MIKGEVPWRLNIFFKDFYKETTFKKYSFQKKLMLAAGIQD